jgi:excisionase family DNA binding protein
MGYIWDDAIIFSRKKPMSTECQTLKIEEAAKILGISRNTAYDAVKTGQLPTVKIGRRFLVPRGALERLLESAAPVAANDSADVRAAVCAPSR